MGKRGRVTIRRGLVRTRTKTSISPGLRITPLGSDFSKKSGFIPNVENRQICQPAAGFFNVSTLFLNVSAHFEVLVQFFRPSGRKKILSKPPGPYPTKALISTKLKWHGYHSPNELTDSPVIAWWNINIKSVRLEWFLDLLRKGTFWNCKLNCSNTKCYLWRIFGGFFWLVFRFCVAAWLFAIVFSTT